MQAPTIYRLFGDKDGLIAAVAEHVMATHVSAKTAQANSATTDLDPVADLHTGWTMHIEFGVANPALFATLIDPRRETTSPARLDGMAVLTTRVHRVALAGLLRVPEQQAVELISSLGTGIVLTITSSPAAQRSYDLVQAGWETVRNTILVTDPGPVATDARSATVAVRAAAPQLTALSETERALLREWLDRVIDT